VPILVFMLMALIDLGRLVSSYEALTNAAREGARFCALHPGDEAGTRRRVRGELGDRVVADLSLTVCPQLAEPVVAGSAVTVTAGMTFRPITPLGASLMGGSALPLRVQATMAVWR